MTAVAGVICDVPSENQHSEPHTDQPATMSQSQPKRLKFPMENCCDVLGTRQIFVTSISTEVTEAELEAFFTQFGIVLCCQLKQYGSVKCIQSAFVTFRSAKEAERAVSSSTDLLVLKGWRMWATPVISRCQTHISELNQDCLRHIFSFLPYKNRIICNAVSQQWREIGKFPVRTLRLVSSCHGETSADLNEALCAYRNTHNCVHTLVLNYVTALTEDDCLHIAASCPHLEVLNFSLASVPAAGLVHIAETCKKLRFYIHRCAPFVPRDEDILSYALANMKSLEALDFSFCRHLSGVCLHYLPKSLTSIDLMGCLGLSHKFITINVFKCLPNLQKLRTYGCKNISKKEFREQWEDNLNDILVKDPLESIIQLPPSNQIFRRCHNIHEEEQ